MFSASAMFFLRQYVFCSLTVKCCFCVSFCFLRQFLFFLRQFQNVFISGHVFFLLTNGRNPSRGPDTPPQIKFPCPNGQCDNGAITVSEDNWVITVTGEFVPPEANGGMPTESPSQPSGAGQRHPCARTVTGPEKKPGFPDL